jgi:hypothetical protein
MLGFLKELKNDDADAIFFLPGDNEDQIHIECAMYKEFGEKVGGSYLGDSYEIILFKEDAKEDKIYNVDRFEAVLSDPLEYMSGLIPQQWYGMVCKKTTTSDRFVQKLFDKLQEV